MEKLFSIPKIPYAMESSLCAANTHKHCHSYHQVLVNTRGMMILADQSSRSVLYGRTAAYIPCGCLHQASLVTQNADFQTVYFSDKNFCKLTKRKESPLPERTVVFQTSRLLLEVLHGLCQYENIRDEIPFAALRLFYLLLESDIRNPTDISLPQAQSEGLREIVEYLDVNYAEEISLQSLEARFFQSHRTIQRMFHKELDMSVFQYLQLRRVFESTLLLISTDKSILEISLDVGYQSLSSFYKAFQKITQQSPKSYRAEFQ